MVLKLPWSILLDITSKKFFRHFYLSIAEHDPITCVPARILNQENDFHDKSLFNKNNVHVKSTCYTGLNLKKNNVLHARPNQMFTQISCQSTVNNANTAKYENRSHLFNPPSERTRETAKLIHLW